MECQNHNKYHGDEICYIVIYYGVLCNISILCWNFMLEFATHCISYIQETSSNLLRGKCIFIHTYTKHHLYTHTIIHKYNLHIHSHTQIKSCTQFNVFYCIFRFFFFSFFFFFFFFFFFNFFVIFRSLPDNCRL